MKERLQKVLAAAGVASRRKAEDLIAAGEVTVNREIARIGDLADPDCDVIEFQGRTISTRSVRTYVAFNKPRGFVTSLSSTHRERTIAELLPSHARLIPAGRLDKDTTGLLLLTDDGEWANIVTHPRYGTEKEYRMFVQGHPSLAALVHMRRGVQLPDGTVTAPATVSTVERQPSRSLLSVTVIEGKKRQLRLMASAVGHPVIELWRIRVGPVELGDLAEGAWRVLRPEEVEGIRAHGRRSAQRSGDQASAAGSDRWPRRRR